jgi:hypothetical protein
MALKLPAAFHGDDGRIARQVARQELGEEPAVDVIAAALAVADQHVQRLAAIEVGDRLSAQRGRKPEHEGQRNRRPQRPSQQAHLISLLGSAGFLARGAHNLPTCWAVALLAVEIDRAQNAPGAVDITGFSPSRTPPHRAARGWPACPTARATRASPCS